MRLVPDYIHAVYIIKTSLLDTEYSFEHLSPSVYAHIQSLIDEIYKSEYLYSNEGRSLDGGYSMYVKADAGICSRLSGIEALSFSEEESEVMNKLFSPGKYQCLILESGFRLGMADCISYINSMLKEYKVLNKTEKTGSYRWHLYDLLKKYSELPMPVDSPEHLKAEYCHYYRGRISEKSGIEVSVGSNSEIPRITWDNIQEMAERLIDIYTMVSETINTKEKLSREYKSITLYIRSQLRGLIGLTDERVVNTFSAQHLILMYISNICKGLSDFSSMIA